MGGSLAAATALLVLSLVGCSAATPSPSGAGPGGRVPVIVDTDLSFDDLLAISYVVRQPTLDLRAVTVVGTGLVHCAQGLQVVTDLLLTFAVSGVPIACGPSEPLTGGHPFPDEWRSASDTAYGLGLDSEPVEMLAQDAPTLIRSIAATASRPIAVLSLGPMTNLAKAFADDAALKAHVAQIVAMAGAVDVKGNVDPGSGALPAEWNVYADPAAADAVFRAGVPITLVPLDATNDVPVTQAFIDRLDTDHAAAPADVVSELFARHGVLEGEYLWDALAAVVMVDPAVAAFETVSLRVVTTEGTDSGRTTRAPDGTAMKVAMSADPAAFETRFLAGLRLGAARAHPFTLTGTIAITFDGATCRDERPDAIRAGVWRIEGRDKATFAAALALVKFHDGAGWADLVSYTANEPDPTVQPPFLDASAVVFADPSATSRVVVTATPGRYGVACLYEKDGKPGVVLGSGEFTIGP
jgi:inosine-uridine nucleoside N-ribohydrolase